MYLASSLFIGLPGGIPSGPSSVTSAFFDDEYNIHDDDCDHDHDYYYYYYDLHDIFGDYHEEELHEYSALFI